MTSSVSVSALIDPRNTPSVLDESDCSDAIQPRAGGESRCQMHCCETKRPSTSSGLRTPRRPTARDHHKQEVDWSIICGARSRRIPSTIEFHCVSSVFCHVKRALTLNGAIVYRPRPIRHATENVLKYTISNLQEEARNGEAYLVEMKSVK